MNDLAWAGQESAYRDACRWLAEPPGPVHLMGIGGVGMAALAVHLKARGHRVTGCDVQPGRVTRWLESLGISVAAGHDPGHLGPGQHAVIYSPAVRAADPELAAARALALPTFTRGVVLPALLRDRPSVAVAGSHGKTTTTAMLVHVFQAAGRPVAFAVGGELDADGRVAAVGGDPLIVEADESDGTVALYEPTHAVLTNAELDHVDYFASSDELDACFRRFASRVRAGLWYGADDPGARRVCAGLPRAHSFGFADAARLRAVAFREEGLGCAAGIALDGAPLGDLALGVPGRTNLLDALGALGVALDAGIPFDAAARALAGFRPVRRRFEIVARTPRRIVVSDYAHHPTEIRALVAQALRLPAQRRIAVYQPHRHSRTAALAASFPPAFEGLDELVLAPVYAASEPPAPGGESADLLGHFRGGTGPRVTLAHSLLEAWDLIRDKWRDGDVLLVIGAGDVDKIAGWAADSLRTPGT